MAPATAAPSKRNRDVKKALGATAPWIWQENDEDFSDLHPPADPLAIGEDEEEQTFAQFMNMARREPNERGTGRWKLTKERRTIALVSLDDDNVSEETLASLQTYLQAFFHTLPVEVHSTAHTISISVARNTLVVQPNHHKTKSRKQVNQRRVEWKLDTCKIDKEPHLEVFSLFDAMVSAFSLLQLDHCYCVIGVTSHNLAEKWIDERGRTNCDAVLGRACGDRVCVVQAPLSSNNNNENNGSSWKSFFATCTHEVLHCFGLDHCTTFRCLMNSQSVLDEECLFLSPLNLKKWVVGVLGLGKDRTTDEYVLARYKAMQRALQTLAVPGTEENVGWLNRKQQLLKRRMTNDEVGTKATTYKRKRNRAPAGS